LLIEHDMCPSWLEYPIADFIDLIEEVSLNGSDKAWQSLVEEGAIDIAFRALLDNPINGSAAIHAVCKSKSTAAH
jgi:hypothetical protein